MRIISPMPAMHTGSQFERVIDACGPDAPVDLATLAASMRQNSRPSWPEDDEDGATPAVCPANLRPVASRRPREIGPDDSDTTQTDKATPRGNAQSQSRIEVQPFGTYRVMRGQAEPEIRNGVETISETEYARLEQTWNALQNRKGKVRFSDDLTPWQYMKVLQAFAALLQRGPVGRQLVMYTVLDGPPLWISAGAGTTTSMVHALANKYDLGPIPRWNLVTIPLYRDLSILYESVGESAATLELHEILGHELGHATSDVFLQRAAIADPIYENLEERLATSNWENALHTEGRTPLRRSHRGSYLTQIPLTEAERQLLSSVASQQGTVASSNALVSLRERLLAFTEDPEISEEGRNVCRQGALQLLARFDFARFRNEFANDYSQDLATVYAQMELGLPYRGAPMPNFHSLGFTELVQELQRLQRAPAELIRTEVEGEHAVLWKSLDRLFEVLNALTLDLELISFRIEYPKDFQNIDSQSVHRVFRR